MPPETIPDTASAPVGFGESLKYWLKLGFISFGGPAGQIAMVHLELVERRRWISEQRFLHALNYCMLLPDPEAQQLATYLGWLMQGVKGGVAAGVLFVLPSLLLLIALTWIYVSFGSLPAVAGILYGIKPAVTAIVVFAAYRIGTRALRHGVLWAIAAPAFVAIVCVRYLLPLYRAGCSEPRHGWRQIHAGQNQGCGWPWHLWQDYGAVLIDDDTPTPGHARFSWARLSGLVIIGVVLWGSVMALL